MMTWLCKALGGQNTKRGAETGDRDASRGDKEGKVLCVTQESVV